MPGYFCLESPGQVLEARLWSPGAIGDRMRSICMHSYNQMFICVYLHKTMTSQSKETVPEEIRV